MLNLKHLYYFHVFAQELSTTKAARRLGITSPALSNQLKQLENIVGVPLSRRIQGKVVISEHGEIVRHYAERMFAAYEELKCKLSSSRESKNSRFRVGICNYLGGRFSFDLLSLIEGTHISQSKRVQITIHSSEVLLAGFMKDEFDMVFGTFAHEVADENDWISHRLTFPVKLFAPLSMRREGKTRDAQVSLTDPSKIVELANSKKISLVLPGHPSILRTETDRFLARSKTAALKTFECNSSNSIVQLIERGVAMGFVPTPCLLDFKSANNLAVFGPDAGYWNHCVSVLIQKSERSSMNQNSDLASIFLNGSRFK